MPTKAPTPCTRCGSPAIKGGRCQRHSRQADGQRGTATQRGYTSDGHQAFRDEVLKAAGHRCAVCGAEADIADHYPHSRRELVVLGMNPDDPRHGRALCKRHHDQHTASTQGLASWQRDR
jgi:5-methylcytosine-specific restriction enzyme A